MASNRRMRGMSKTSIFAALGLLLFELRSILVNRKLVKGTTTKRQSALSLLDCHEGYVFMQNRMLPKEVTHKENRAIPRTIHFILQSKCVPNELAHDHKAWKALVDHSIIYHDQSDIDNYMKTLASKDTVRKEFADSIWNAYNCALEPRAKLDIARFVILWEFGGIAVDMDSVPGPAFLKSPEGANGTIIDDADESVFEVDGKWTVNPRFIATAPHHPVLYVAITSFLAKGWTPDMQSLLYMDLANNFHEGPDSSQVKTTKRQKNGFMNSTMTQINNERTKEELFTQIKLSNSTKDGMELNIFSLEQYKEQCKAIDVLDNNSFEVDVESLKEIVGRKGDAIGNETIFAGTEYNGVCPNGLVFIPSHFDSNSVMKGRKIPKIVHMTSKSRCFTGKFANNINLWRFFPDHSFLMHDDTAVDRLFDRDWPEFPLLKEVLSCIATGAGKADLWRYLLLWEYGGIYTDLDNAPGQEFNNGTVITDQMDSFLEQERGGFPSQYFLAASPHHPVMYNMVKVTIHRLLDVSSIKNQYVPFVTGPGATKSGVIWTIGGSGYPTKGEYAGVHGRNVTIVGSPQECRQRKYVWRDSVSKGSELKHMNMTHYGNAKNEGGKLHSCFAELYSLYKN